MKKSIVFVFTVLIFVLAAFSSVGAQGKMYVTLGQYEQDNNVSNGPEEIEWLVLAIVDQKALLVSKYGLDTKPFNEIRKEITWENSTIRNWLNNEFYNNAFSSSEKNKIIPVKNNNSDNPQLGTKGGNPTTDRIFLLSVDEVLQYMTDSSSRRCKATAFAKSKNSEEYPNGYNWWWLRTPGAKEGAVHVYNDGDIYYNGGAVSNSNTDLVRPALWIEWK